MSKELAKFTSAQMMFQELFIGTLIYVVVLGFMNDYTNIVQSKTFSTIFFSSIVLEILTYLAFKLKSQIIRRLKNRQGLANRALMFFFVWLVMFSSKFIFIWVLDLLFGNYISINGFFGILSVVLVVTAVHKLAFWVFNRLGLQALDV